MIYSLSEMLDSLDLFSEQISLDRLASHIKHLAVDWSDLSGSVRFDRARYQRNLLRAGEAYHALLLCWKPGQRSPIHDHRGSNCAVRILRGTATESSFLTTEQGLVYPTGSRDLQEGTQCASASADIHQVSNLRSDEDLITLHIYSPPLLVMGQYPLTDSGVTDFADPVFEYSLGGGI
ncbi:MAG: cysteine dioxygenase family protein [Planctomycetes bacterium]|nr:cysteine dioxygenase family protein [Planctomycetota bacterium]